MKIPVFVLSLVPVLLLGLKALNGDLGANPIEFVTHWTGDWAIRFLCITLAITPLRKLLGLPELIRVRRMLGLFCFFYACLHFMTWFMLDKFFDWNEIAKDVVKRPFITAIAPSQITSTFSMPKIRVLAARCRIPTFCTRTPALVWSTIRFW